MKKNIGRPKIKNKKENISLSINSEIDNILTEYIKDKNITKSQYVEYLIKKEIEKAKSLKNK
jgi:hypothetical protein